MIKESFLYNNNLYKEIEKKQTRKLVSKLVIFALIMIIFILISIFILKIEDRTNILNKIAIVSLSICFIDFFPLFYYFLIFITSLKNDYLYHGKVYVITNDNRFYDMKFIGNYNYAKYNPDRNIIKSVIDLIYTDISIKNDNKNIAEKISGNNINIKDLYSCYEIVNIYSIKKFYNRFEIKCDYIDKMNNKVIRGKTYSIYKYFDNYDQLYNFLKSKISDTKEIIKDKPIKNNQLIDFALNMSKNKSIYIISFLLPFFMLGSLYTSFVILFFIYFVNVYIAKKALKEELEENEEKKLNKYIKINTVIMIICLILSIVFTIIYKIKITNLIYSYALFTFFITMIIIMFKKK